MTPDDIVVRLFDRRDGCTYERVYMQTPDWSKSTRDLIGLVLPECWPDYADARGRYGDGKATGIIRDDQSQVIGTFHVQDVNREEPAK